VPLTQLETIKMLR